MALRDIVDDVLDFGKLAHSAREPALPRHALVDLTVLAFESARACWLRRLQWQSVSGAPSILHMDTGSVDVELTLEYEDRALVKNWWITLDVSGFTRVLNNLVTNSLKYTPAGTITISLISGHGVDKDGNAGAEITLRVADTGLGIAPDFLARLFEPFTQADSFSPGAGLGLHICKSILDRMHGSITVEPRPGGGSVFTVVFPVEDIELAPAGAPLLMVRKVVSADPTPRSAHADDATAPRIPPGLPHRHSIPPNEEEEEEGQEPHLKILVVDDNVISRKILVAMLKRLNATAYQADDGVNALKVFREAQPQVVWTDISMPRMDGVTAAKEMRRIEREEGWVPAHIVAITGLGLSDEHIRREALLGPAALDGWLIKGQTNLKTMKKNLVAVRRKLRGGFQATISTSPTTATF
ncbi:histidine kinase-like ATPase [Mycena vulgaris]|nr:histidine kinase-like ATPase [Mycena vulgaris]